MSRIRQWTGRAGFSILDQGLSSAASFGLNVLLARILPAQEYGAFAMAFTIFLVASSFHSALIIEPMSVLGPARHHDDLAGYLRRVIWNHLAVTGVLGAASLGIGFYFRHDALGPALMAMGVSCPLILLFWAIRKAYYLETRPDLAAAASGIHLAVLTAITAVFWRAHLLNAATGFLGLALASAVAAIFSMKQLGVGLRIADGEVSDSMEVGRELWNFGRWILPSALFFPLLAQVQMLMTGAFLGLGAAGILKALQNPILPVIQVVTALSTLAIPVLARDFGANRAPILYRRGILYTAAMAAVALAYELVVLASGNLWDRAFYGGRYASYDWLMPVLGLVPIATAVATGCSVVLRAIQRPELTTVTHVCGGVFGVVASYFLIKHKQLPGAVYGLLASHTVTALVSVYLTVRVRSPKALGHVAGAAAAAKG